MNSTPLHRVIAEGLVQADFDTMFGLMGDGNLWLIDTYVREFGGTYVAATHESNAVCMATGWAKRTGRVGLATVTHGPGLTNIVTALTDASRARVPMVIVVGDTAVEMRDHSQRLAQRDVVVPTGAGFEQVRTPQTAVTDLETAVRRAVAEARPIVLNLPRPFLLAEVPKPKSFQKCPTLQATAPDSRKLDDALGVLASARRPLVLAGRGAIGARDELVALADISGAVLGTTLQGQSLFAGHPFDLGIVGSIASQVTLDVLSQTDAVVAFGASLNQHTTLEGSLLDGKRLVQVDLHQDALGRYQNPDVTIQGDAATVASAMHEALVTSDVSAGGARNDHLLSRLAADRQVELVPIATKGGVDVQRALAAIASVLPECRAVTTDLGRFVIDAWKAVTVPTPDRYVHTNNFGSIGLGMGYAIGMTFAEPHEPVVLITGDGGFMMGGLAELRTAVRHCRDLIVVVVNDGAYGAEHVQFRDRGMNPDLTGLDLPDLAKVASAIGASSVSIRSMDGLDAALAEILHRGPGPLLVDLVVHPEDVLARGFQ